MIDPTPGLLTPEGLWWARAFSYLTYTVAAVCLYGAWIHSRRRLSPTWIGDLLIFSSYVGAFWLLESYASFQTPWFLYPANFPHTLPILGFVEGAGSWFAAPSGACVDCVHDIEARLGSGIPLAIPIMEASLVFSVLCVCRFFEILPRIRPWLGGLVLFSVDFVVDPIVTVLFSCSAEVLGAGIGLWQWYPDPGCKYDMRGWLQIPLYNFAAWFASPVLLLSLTTLIGRLVSWLYDSRPGMPGRGSKDPSPPEASDLLFMAIAAAAMFVVISASPNVTRQFFVREIVMFTALGIAVTFCWPTIWGARRSKPMDWRIAAPPLAHVLFPALMLLGTGFFGKSRWLLVLAGAGACVLLLLLFGRHQHVASRVTFTLRQLDIFFRIHYFGFTAILLLLGAASVAEPVEFVTLRTLLLVGASFHVFAYVFNDVIDYPIDRTQPRRQSDPLVSGRVNRRFALVLALLTIPTAFAIHLREKALDDPGGAEAAGLLLAAFAGMAFYNLFGKRVRFPILTDAVEGAAWGCLALWGASVAGDGPVAATWPVFLYGFGFIFLINGIHGGLRDLKNDLHCDARTTAILLGARPGAEHEIEHPRGVQLFGFAIHGGLLLLVVVMWMQNEYESALMRGALLALALLIGLVSTRRMARVVAPRNPNRDDDISMHLFLLLLPVVVLAVPALPAMLAWSLFLAFLGPLLLIDPPLAAIATPLGGGEPPPWRDRKTAVWNPRLPA